MGDHIERLCGQLNLATAMLASAEKEVAEAAAFLDALAERLSSLPRWQEECGCYTPTRMAATDCRAMAAKLRGET